METYKLMMKEALAITVQNTIAKLGLIPNETGDFVREVMSFESDNSLVEIPALGCYLGECVKVGNYKPLLKGMKDITKGRKENAN